MREYRYDVLRNIGLTNADSMNYGELASARPARKTFALCCGAAHNVNVGYSCPTCKSALFWRSEVVPIAERAIENYFAKCEREYQKHLAKLAKDADKQRAKELNLMPVDFNAPNYKARHEQRVAAANRERAAIAKMKEGINGETQAS